MYSPPVDQQLPDYRDDEEREAVARILEVLPAEHPAHAAHVAGKDTIRMTHLVADRPELVRALMEVYYERSKRIRAATGHFRP